VIGGMQWKGIKDQAMMIKYKEQSWYKGLTAADKKIVEALRLDQRIQGDMDELNPAPSNDGRSSNLTAAT